MLLANGEGQTAAQFQYKGVSHGKIFNSHAKPRRALFSTYEPLSNYEARFNATARILEEQE